MRPAETPRTARRSRAPATAGDGGRRAILVIATLWATLSCALPALASTPAPGPFLATTGADPLADVPSYGTALLRMVLALVAVLILLVIALKILQRTMRSRGAPTTGAGALRVVDRVQLEPGRNVYLVRVDEQFLVVGTGEQGVTLLADQSLDHAALRARFADAGRPASKRDERRFAEVLGGLRRAAPSRAPAESTDTRSSTP